MKAFLEGEKAQREPKKGLKRGGVVCLFNEKSAQGPPKPATALYSYSSCFN